MLSELAIRDFAIIDDLQLNLGAGMTVLSGETGAGKSILIDALGLLLGDRADASAVRDGRDRAEISAIFDLTDAPAARTWLSDRELADESECLIRRVVSREGRSRHWINGSPAAGRDLRELGEHLVDIHGQHAHQSLLRPGAQRDLLDEHGHLAPQLAALGELVRELQACERNIHELDATDDAGQSRLELLQFQVAELQALAPVPDEWEALTAEHRRLANAEQLLRDGQSLLALLTDEDTASAIDRLGQAERQLGDLSALDDGFAGPAELISGARIQAQEAADDLRRQLDGIALDPERLATVESRMEAIQDLARKHQCRPAELPAQLDELTAALERLEGGRTRLAELQTRRDQLRTDYANTANQLHRARREAAGTLAAAVTEGLRDLGMPAGLFEIDVEARSEAPVSVSGHDRVHFRVSANPGQAPRSLERVASGGELSRISLAIQMAAVGGTPIPTLVFDEVDAGIGGGVAEIVGRCLRRLADQGQVLCVTHLPQVAAQARHHLQVAKQVVDGHTRTDIRALDDDARIEELARMLGGLEITERTLDHAREMRDRAES
ncbi:DNA repair protein RecN [Spectribacter hydrogenoxidans]|uniref:DNA repair protein RecN n=1 Tax=Spectribacter hydrogenoxidans TaxID=3075608 RepID=A0ABU3BXN1_9GAMM|nr:DNA repair protein RecN [Salinisphaera sp. W335]MDT0634015.1 DNA repair protein RecN [Salinisphaera sp. W335]